MSHPADSPMAAPSPARPELFALPPGVIYLNGNSLGALPHAVVDTLDRAVREEWGQQLVGAWNTAGWVDLPRRLGDRIGERLGAAGGQMRVCDSTSINLYKLTHAALQWHPARPQVLLEAGAFPTDNYIAESLCLGRPATTVEHLSAEAISDRLSDARAESVAAVVLSHVNYRTGARVDLPRLQALAARHDVPVVWDLAHSAGVVPLALDAWGVDYAVGCGYKFLNGGPGAPAFAYVAQRRQATLQPVLPGWFGHARPFAFEATYSAASGADRLQVGTPPILSMRALETAVEVLAAVDADALWRHAIALFERLLAALEADPVFAECTVLTPRAAEQRGSQLSLEHPQAFALCRALAAEGVVADYREPGILRLGLAPLYLTLADMDRAAAMLLQILREQRWQKPQFHVRPQVT